MVSFTQKSKNTIIVGGTPTNWKKETSAYPGLLQMSGFSVI